MANATVPTDASRPQAGFNWGRLFTALLLALIIFVTLFPFWWVIRTGLTSSRLVFTDTSSLLPVGATLDNFIRVLGLVDTETAVAAGGSGQSINFFLFLRNSIIVSTIIAVGQVFFSSSAAYAFARLKFPFRDQLFFLYISALMVPAIVTLIPNFILMRQLEWLNTFAGVVAPYLLMTPFAVFFLRQFYLGINREIEEAAKIDGANIFAVYWRVILPISRPPLITLGIITFIQSWNEYLWPLIVGKEEGVRVLTVALGIFRSQTPQGAPDWSGLMAGTTLAIIPTLILFFVLGRRVLDSIQFTGFK
ncbi:carbohydrate ABC transporter permease [Candidatus Leptofilum sp.]|uniref:carbohydrate ABC transporter permease n=1 Tax=Candidatus Leptofilum sp. TaxID=3241576 RepID=UPI003B58D956